MGKGTIKTKAMTMAVAMSMVAGLCPSTVFAANSEDVAKVLVMNMIRVRLTLSQELQQIMDCTEEVSSVILLLKIQMEEHIICHTGQRMEKLL